VEVLFAVAILSILAMIAMPSYEEYQKKARDAQAVADITELSQKLEKYRIINYAHPSSLDALAFNRKDPWGNDYLYLDLSSYSDTGAPPSDGKPIGRPRKDKLLKPLNTDYDLFSMGPDGDFKTPLSAKVSHDDIVRAYDGAYIGVAEYL
jgi:general secretion pathway protein G